MDERNETFAFFAENGHKAEPDNGVESSSMATKLKLKENNLIKYSPTEKVLFEILIARNGKPIDTEALANKFYDGDVPYNGRTIISGSINNLIRKTKWNKEEFKVYRSKRAGPNSTTVWVDHPDMSMRVSQGKR
jgi:hypothetical protein